MIISKDFLLKAIPAARIAFSDLNFQSIKSYPYDFFNSFENKNYTIAIDSREIATSDLFIALGGKKVNGHDFIKNALDNGAAGAIVEFSKIDSLKLIPQEQLDKKIFIAVPNTFEALLSLARSWRNSFNIPIVGISGSVGKTSTKEMLKSILSAAKIQACITHKNQNTIIGLCMSILKLSPKDKCGVFELGIQYKGDMDELADMLRPTIGILTCITKAHSEHLGSLSEIAKEKLKIFKNFKSDNLGIICGDQAILSNISYSHPVLRFGYKLKNQVHARRIKLVFQSNENRFDFPSVHFDIKIYGRTIPAVLNVPNEALVKNALAASAAAHILKCSDEDILKGLASYKTIEGRFEVCKIQNSNSIIINDCYNANPQSMKASLEAFDKLESKGRKIAIIGDMLELGEKEKFYHKQLGRFMSKLPSINNIIFVGNKSKITFQEVSSNIQSSWVSSWGDAKKIVQEIIKDDDLILIKGSRGVGLLNIAKELSR